MSISLPDLHKAMKAAIAAGRTRLGATSPNPAVGAVALDKEGNILATAMHDQAGHAHAEALLLQICREQNLLPQIDTLCVTLEPCNHYGRTPPCTEAIIQAGIQNIVIGMRDPNPHVAGGGIERLEQAGLHVTGGINEDECKWLIHAFLYKAKSGKPWVTVKRAFDAQGSMIPAASQKTFTSPSSLKLAHQLRKKADAILTGSGTILADHPLFTVRHVIDYPEKKRWLAIMDRRGRVDDHYLKNAIKRGFIPIVYTDINEAFDDLNQKGAHDILVEAGPILSAQILRSQHWTMAVDIRQAEKDNVAVEFASSIPILLNIHNFNWDWFLPSSGLESLL